MKKKIVVLVLSLGMVLSMTACGDESSSNVGNGRESTSNSGVTTGENTKDDMESDGVEDDVDTDTAPVECFDYEERSDGTIEITYYNSNEYNYKVIEFPEEIEGKKVTAIGMVDEKMEDSSHYCVFLDENVEKIVIPDTVEEIGGYAIFDCANLKEVEIGSGVKRIGQYAFSGCNSLETIIIPDGVETMEEGVFSTCNNLKEAYVPASVTTVGIYGVFDTYSEDLVIYGEAGSAIETYANEHGLTFVAQ